MQFQEGIFSYILRMLRIVSRLRSRPPMRNMAHTAETAPFPLEQYTVPISQSLGRHILPVLQ